MSAWRAKADRERALAAQAAVVAATTGDVDALHTALTVAAAPPPAARARVTYRWAIQAIDIAALPMSYHLPDAARIAREARGCGDTPPAIPGVTWAREASIGARR